MSKIIIILFTLSFYKAVAQPVTPSTILYGVITKESLTAAPYNKWFDSIYTAYKPQPLTVSSLKKLPLKDFKIEVFFGTWCGDSKREVPRFYKLMNELSFDPSKIKLIALGDGDSLYKQSPQHEERGKGIFRVPTFIVYKNGKELNRIIEFPALSLEKDLFAIFNERTYIPNAASSFNINKWLLDGTLSDDNINTTGLAAQLKPVILNERELNTAGYVLLEQGLKKEALKVFSMNRVLYPESFNVLSSLGEAYYENGDYKNASVYLERSLSFSKNADDIKAALAILYKAKGIK